MSAASFAVAGYVRRARRLAGLSQRELARHADVAPSTIARLEGSNAGRPSLALVETLLRAAGLRLAVLDASGDEVQPMPEQAQRDFAGRHFPSHLDVRRCRRYGDWWYQQWQTTTLDPPSHTFDLRRWVRDDRRQRLGTTAEDDDERHDIVGDGVADRRVRDIVNAYLPGHPRPPWLRW